MGPIILLLVCCGFGYLGFREARSFRRENGISPWGWDPMIWGAVVFLSVLLGAILLAIARHTTKASTSRAPA